MYRILYDTNSRITRRPSDIHQATLRSRRTALSVYILARPGIAIPLQCYLFIQAINFILLLLKNNSLRS